MREDGVASIRTPVLNIIDAIWVSHLSLKGYPAETTTRTNQLMAGQDPVALDFCAAKHILYPVDRNPRHHPRFSGIDQWLVDARDTINRRGGLYSIRDGVLVHQSTKETNEMVIHKRKAQTSA